MTETKKTETPEVKFMIILTQKQLFYVPYRNERDTSRIYKFSFYFVFLLSNK